MKIESHVAWAIVALGASLLTVWLLVVGELKSHEHEHVHEISADSIEAPAAHSHDGGKTHHTH